MRDEASSQFDRPNQRRTPRPPEGSNEAGSAAPIPDTLQNWQVIEIEGEATIVEDQPIAETEPLREGPLRVGPLRAGQTHDEPASRPPGVPYTITDHIDDVLVLSLPTRRFEVEPDGSTQIEVTVFNNGDRAAVFEVTVEGWVYEKWFSGLPIRLNVPVGERLRATIPIDVPREPESTAGEHQLAVVARSPQHPARTARLAATLVIAPYAEFRLGLPQQRRQMDSWLGRSTLFVVPLANLGNVATTFQIVGADRLGRCRFDFRLPNITGGDLEGQGWIHLEAGDTAQIPVIVTPLQRPLIGIGRQRVPIRFLVHAIGSHERPRTVDAATDVSPVIGIWHMLGVLALIALLIVGVMLAGVAALWTVRQSAPTAAVQPPPATVEQPAVTILINTIAPGAPAATNATTNHVSGALAAAQVSERGGPAAEPGAELPLLVGGVPVVNAQQVTAPGEPVPAGVQPIAQSNAQPIVVRPDGGSAAQTANLAASRPAGMTYAQMFQEIAMRYDLDWRMLAAQAYIESGFDSLALGSQGDLGLMQIRPATWREWAPTVDAADPFDSYSNVLVGAAYLDYLRSFFGQRGYPQVEWMLVAYYWGPDHVLEYLQSGGTWDELDPDLRNYALDILRIAQTLPNN